jgi:hypothetical protein
MVKMTREILGIAIDDFDRLLGNHFEKGGRPRDFKTPPQSLASCFDSKQVVSPTAHEMRLGHGKMKKADLLCDSTESTHEIGEDAVDACIMSMELLVLVGRNKQPSCRGRQARC